MMRNLVTKTEAWTTNDGQIFLDKALAQGHQRDLDIQIEVRELVEINLNDDICQGNVVDFIIKWQARLVKILTTL